MKAIKCDTCGGDIKFGPDGKIATCKFCGNKMFINNPNEPKEMIQRVVIEDRTQNTNNNNTLDSENAQAAIKPEVEPVFEAIEEKKKRGCFGTTLLVLLWLVLWPILIFVTIFRNKNWSVKKRWAIAAVTFIVLMIISTQANAASVSSDYSGLLIMDGLI